MNTIENNESAHETINNLSPATLAKIAQARDLEAEGKVSKTMADRHVRAIIALATGKDICISNEIDEYRMHIALNGLFRIDTLLNMIMAKIEHKLPEHDVSNIGDGAEFELCDLREVHEILEIVQVTTLEVGEAIFVICAA